MSDSLNKWAPIPLRRILGFGFLYHGLPKLISAEGHEMFLGMLQNIGVPAAGFMTWLVGTVEVVGGAALIAGAFAAITSALLIADMLVPSSRFTCPSGSTS